MIISTPIIFINGLSKHVMLILFPERIKLQYLACMCYYLDNVYFNINLIQSPLLFKFFVQYIVTFLDLEWDVNRVCLLSIFFLENGK